MRERRGRPWILSCVVAPVVLLFGSYVATDYLERRGEQFFQTGKAVVGTLQSMARMLEAKDLAAIGQFYAGDFRGSRLGIARLEPVWEKDGIRAWRFVSSGEAAGRSAALDEWRRYLESFQSIEEAALHIHRLEQWKGPDEWAATVRFELIGTPRGASRAGIDRALFRMEFQPDARHPRIRSASLIEGGRMLGDAPQFENVTRAAGIAFRNQYYPPFLQQPLKFGMIRYGPAGISAADYDNDGSYDLFIPDGVESKLFRNRDDGGFEDATQAAGLGGLDGVSAGVFADYDNDGWKDLFVSRTFRPNQLFRNNGDGTFTDVTARSGIGADNCTTVASWADYDNDGYLDLYVGRYLDPRKDIPTTFYARNGEPNQLYHNNGDGTFSNVTAKAG
ncbi:MAG: VCBS repeat-containing protein, partial [Acidobacteria bacterium]|nr:VCBS repeat-containing protein [Acidobacteriota bacterium]